MAIKLNVKSAEPTSDGSGEVAFDIEALDSEGDPIPGSHSTIRLSADDVVEIVNADNPALVAAQKFGQANPAFALEALESKVDSNNQASQNATDMLSKFNLPVEIPAK